MPALVAFLDANVLYPSALRSFLLHLALADLYRARWSNAVHEEWISNLLRSRPDLTRERLERTRRLMDKATLDSLVEDYEALIPSLHLPDEDDRHILAAAIVGGAQVIVTKNLKDFPAAALRPHRLEAQHPDKFVQNLIERSPDLVLQAAETHRQTLKNPPQTVAEYLVSLEAQGLPGAAAALRLVYSSAV